MVSLLVSQPVDISSGDSRRSQISAEEQSPKWTIMPKTDATGAFFENR